MKKELRHVCISLLGMYVIVLSVAIPFGYIYMANEFKDKVSGDNACINIVALLLFVIVFVKYIFYQKKLRLLHYYLVAYAIFVGIFFENGGGPLLAFLKHGFSSISRDLLGTLHGLSLVIVPFAFAIILLFDEIKQSIMKSRTTPTSK